jgi:hypothetical protein
MRKLPFVLSVTALLAFSLMTPQLANADTVTGVGSAQYSATRAANPNSDQWPLLFEDNDSSETDDVDGSGDLSVGDIIRGVLEFSAIEQGDPTNTLDPTGIGGINGVLLGGVANNQLAAIYELLVVGHADVGPAGASPGDVFTLGSVLVGDRVKLAGVADGRMMEIYESAVKAYSEAEATYSDAADNVTDSGAASLWAIAGLTAGGNNTQFYTITITSATGADIEISLNFIDDSGPSAIGPLKKNSFGTDIYGSGDIDSIASSFFYDTESDTNFVMLFAPVPAAFGPGIALLGVLGLVYHRRRRTA